MSNPRTKSAKPNKQQAPQRPSRLWIVAIVAIILCGIVWYSNTLDSPFFFDDDTSIVSNDAIKENGGLAEIWKSDKRRTVPYLTFAANYAAHGLKERGYHVVNLGIHIAAGCAVFWLAWLLLGSPAMKNHPLVYGIGRGKVNARFLFALFVALLFVSHPVQTQAVTYIVQRMASLAALFSLLGMACYAAFAEQRAAGAVNSRGWAFFAAGILSIVLGMFTKENTFIVPLAIVLMDMLLYSRTGDERRKAVVHLLPFLATLAIIPLMIVSASSAAGGVKASMNAEVGSKIPTLHYLFTQFNVITTYIRLLFLPIGQNLDYQYPISTSLLSGATPFALAFLLALGGYGIWLWKRHPLASFGILFFFLALSVESSVLSLPDVIFEHRLYLPMFGFLLALGSGLFYVASFGAKRSIGSAVLPATLAAIVFVAGIATYQRNEVWSTVESLWGDVIQKSPGKARGYVNIGDFFYKRQRNDLALPYFRKAVQVDSNSSSGYNNLSCVLWAQGQLDEAEIYARRAIYLKPDVYQAYSILGSVHFNRGKLDSAEALFRKAIELRPTFVDAHANLGAVYMRRQQLDSAVVQFNKALDIAPNHPQANHNIAISYFNMGRYSDAARYANRSRQLGAPVPLEMEKRLRGGAVPQ